MLLKIVWKNILDKKLNSILSIILMMLGISIIALLINIGKQLQEKFSNNIAGIDMVVGAKGSPLQLILSSVYQIDAPTGNVPLDEINQLKSNPMVMYVVPISMGDNYKGSRIVGTTKQYLVHYKAKYSQGKLFENDFETVIGGGVAAQHQLKLGDTFTSSHGFDQNTENVHKDQFKVVGILETNNSVIDNLIITNLSSVWAMHDHEESNESVNSDHHEENHIDDTNAEEKQADHDLESDHKKEVTSALVRFRNPLGLMTIPRNINSNTKMQAALPAIEINRLFELMGIGIDVFKYLAGVIILISGISVFITLFNALKERKFELALMLSMGGTRTRLFLMLVLEGIILSVLGWLAGIAVSKIGLALTSNLMNNKFKYTFSSRLIEKEEIYLLIAALLVGIFAAAIPALGIYKINITKTLAND